MGKVQSAGKKGSRQEVTCRELRNWIILTFLWIGFIFVLYGTAEYYFPDPIPLAFGLYGDIPTAIIYGGFAIWTATISFKIIYKKKG